MSTLPILSLEYCFFHCFHFPTFLKKNFKNKQNGKKPPICYTWSHCISRYILIHQSQVIAHFLACAFTANENSTSKWLSIKQHIKNDAKNIWSRVERALPVFHAQMLTHVAGACKAVVNSSQSIPHPFNTFWSIAILLTIPITFDQFRLF